MSALSLRLIQAGIVAAILLIMAAAGYFLFMAPRPDVENLEIATEFAQYMVTARVYQSQTGSLDGVCQGMHLPPGVKCDDTDDAYAMDMRLGDGKFYCADSSGYAGKQDAPRRQPLACR